MDNKEAAEVIAAMRKHEIDILKINALELAIKALEQESCEDWYDIPSDEMTLEQARQAVKDLRKKLAECLKQEPCDEEYIKIPKKALKYRTTGMVAYNTEWLKNHFDIERAVICGEQEPCEDAISRSEAIRIASGYCHWSNIPDELAKLPSVNPIPCDDAISRQAVLDAMRELPHEYRNAEQRARTGGIAACQVIVEELPPVSVAEKTGRWVEIDDEPHEVWECDHCGFVIDGSGCIDPYEYKDIYKYCPSCGCFMKGDNDEWS